MSESADQSQCAVYDFGELRVPNGGTNTVGGTATAVNGAILCGLHVQVGAAYQDLDPSRDSSREIDLTPGTIPLTRRAEPALNTN
ncbi:MAG: hypothetical protein CL569_05210 [Alphaproteobacteria bacterium]|nr:hypothetical protein [Alphaproteobacteria bacterium]|tara:strand:- start:29440 stop:29694 length:255 start_codon:yes stop_codon:yes gene_type:complete